MVDGGRDARASDGLHYPLDGELGGHVSRGHTRYSHKHCLPRYSGLGPVRGTLRAFIVYFYVYTAVCRKGKTPVHEPAHARKWDATDWRLARQRIQLRTLKCTTQKNQNANEESIRVYSGQIRLYIRTVYRHTRKARRRVDRRRLDSGSGRGSTQEPSCPRSRACCVASVRSQDVRSRLRLADAGALLFETRERLRVHGRVGLVCHAGGTR